VAVTGLTSGVTMISVTDRYACALQSGGVKCWGAGANGKLGNGGTSDSSTPVSVTGLTSGVQTISAGWNHGCAVTTSGAAYCWGLASSGRLGNQQSSGSYSTPQAVYGMGAGVTTIAAGASASCAVQSGNVLCWGSGTSGEIGNGLTSNQTQPVNTLVGP
jgi:alpha-tubulin suppressor-like RCC1 family protein